MILQGEVELIAQMKPKAQTENEDGLLEYLEDIIGTTIYKRPIEDSGKIVEQLNDERAEKLNRLKYVEKEKNALEVGFIVLTIAVYLLMRINNHSTTHRKRKTKRKNSSTKKTH